MALSAILNVNALVAPAQDSGGNAVGLQLTYPATKFTIPFTQGQQRAQAYTLINPGDTQNIDFGAGTGSASLTTAQFLLLWSSSLFIVGGLTFNGGAAGAVYATIFMFGIGKTGNQLTNSPVFVQAVTANQVINTMIGG